MASRETSLGSAAINIPKHNIVGGGREKIHKIGPAEGKSTSVGLWLNSWLYMRGEVELNSCIIHAAALKLSCSSGLLSCLFNAKNTIYMSFINSASLAFPFTLHVNLHGCKRSSVHQKADFQRASRGQVQCPSTRLAVAAAAEFNCLSQTKPPLLKHGVWSRTELLAAASIIAGKPSCVCSAGKVFIFNSNWSNFKLFLLNSCEDGS